MSNTWAGIVRVSHMGDRKAGSDSFHADDDQIKAIKQYAAQHGAQVEIMPPELGISGGKPIEQRPALRAAIEGVERGDYSAIVVAYLSRLTRSRSGLEIWDRVEAAGGHVHSAAEQLDTSTPNGRFIRDIHLANNVREREEHVVRFDDRRRLATQSGVWQRRQTPLGYSKDPKSRHLKPDKDAGRVQKAFAKRASGESIPPIARYLGMTNQGARKLLSNRVYLGELKVGQYINPEAHEPLIDVDTFEACQIKGPRPGRNPNRTPALLAGLVRCAGCGHRLARSGSARNSAYSCAPVKSGARCPAPAAITARLINEHVERIALQELQRMDIRTTGKDGIKEARAAVKAAEEELASYLSAVSADDLGVTAFRAGAIARQQKIAEARDDFQRQLSARTVVPIVKGGVQAWRVLDEQNKNTLLRALLEVVIVRRGGGPGSRTALNDRVRVIAHGTGIELPVKPGGTAMGIHPLVFPDINDEGVLRVLGS